MKKSVLLGFIFLSLLSGCNDLNQQNSSHSPIVLQNTLGRDTYIKILAEHQNNQNTPGLNSKTWGVIVPHHLLAIDVIGETLNSLKNNSYATVYILSPDHFNRAKTNIVIPDLGLKTSVGIIDPDQKTISEILKTSSTGGGKNISAQNEIFSYEHGISGVIPFIQLLWPEAKIIPIIVRSDTTPEELEPLINYFHSKIQDGKSLIVISTDFSHYLTPEAAAQMDKSTINDMDSLDPDKIFSLNQPNNSDALNLLYLIKRVESLTNGKHFLFLHKNSQDYFRNSIKETTSYLSYYFFQN